MKRLFVLVLCLNSVIGLAAQSETNTLPPLETHTFVYHPRISDRFQLYLNAISRGYPIGEVEHKRTQPPATPDQSLSGIAAALQKSVSELQDALLANRKKLYERIKSAQIMAAEKPPAAGEKTQPVEFDFAQFTRCVSRSLPVLKARFKAAQNGDEIAGSLYDETLDKDRGDGRGVSPSGVVCGRYLGPYGLVSEGYIEDIKLASCFLAAKSEDDTARLVAYQILRSEKPAPFWLAAWKDSCLRAVVLAEGIVLPDSLIDRFAARIERPVTRSKTGAVTFVAAVVPQAGTASELRAQWEASMTLAKKLIGATHANP